MCSKHVLTKNIAFIWTNSTNRHELLSRCIFQLFQGSLKHLELLEEREERLFFWTHQWNWIPPINRKISCNWLPHLYLGVIMTECMRSSPSSTEGCQSFQSNNSPAQLVINVFFVIELYQRILCQQTTYDNFVINFEKERSLIGLSW